MKSGACASSRQLARAALVSRPQEAERLSHRSLFGPKHTRRYPQPLPAQVPTTHCHYSVFYLVFAVLHRVVLAAGIGNVGVGSDLKYSYGTSAITYPNGTIVAIARLSALRSTGTRCEDCLCLLPHILHLQPSKAMPISLPLTRAYATVSSTLPPLPRLGPPTTSQVSQSFGLPALTDVDITRTLVKVLKEETERDFGFRMLEAAVLNPYFTAIYDEDFYDSLK